jgi:TonB family protein
VEPARRVPETAGARAPEPLAVEPQADSKTTPAVVEARREEDAHREPQAALEAAAPPASVPAAPQQKDPAQEAAQPQRAEAVAGQESKTSFRRGDLIREGDTDVVPPILRSVPEPRMPRLVERQRRDAMILVRVLVDEFGNVTAAEVQDNDPAKKVFHAEALRAAKSASFEPGTRGGVPGKMYSTLPVRFRAGG